MNICTPRPFKEMGNEWFVYCPGMAKPLIDPETKVKDPDMVKKCGPF